MKKSNLNEVQRMQQLAGINESQLNEAFTSEQVTQILANNGIDDDYFDEIGAMEVEGGTEEWMDVLSEITGKDAYDSTFTPEDDLKIQQFISTMEAMGIELI
jgi:hypothetical protein